MLSMAVSMMMQQPFEGGHKRNKSNGGGGGGGGGIGFDNYPYRMQDWYMNQYRSGTEYKVPRLKNSRVCRVSMFIYSLCNIHPCLISCCTLKYVVAVTTHVGINFMS